MADYKISTLAEGDIDRIYEYGLEQFGEVLADKHHMEIYAHLDFIAENPKLYSDSEFSGFKKSIYKGYSIFYRVMGDESVYIVRIIGRQDQNRMFQ